MAVQRNDGSSSRHVVIVHQTGSARRDKQPVIREIRQERRLAMIAQHVQLHSVLVIDVDSLALSQRKPRLIVQKARIVNYILFVCLRNNF